MLLTSTEGTVNTTRDFLAAIKARHALKTDGDLHRLLGVSRERISRYQKGHDYFGEEVALRVADALDISPGYVLAIVAAERAKSEAAKKVWKSVAAKAAAVLVFVILAGALPGLPNMQATAYAGNLYIMSSLGSLSILLILFSLISALPKK